MKKAGSRVISLQYTVTILQILLILLSICGTIPSLVTADDEYSQGWLGIPNWVLERVDTSMLPDFYYPKNVTDGNKENQAISELIIEGNNLLNTDSFHEAKNKFEEVIERDPDSFDAWLGRGHALVGVKRYQSALESYEKAIVLSGNEESAWSAYAGKGSVSFELHQYQQAKEAFEQSIDLVKRSKSNKTEVMINLTTDLSKAMENLG